MTQIDLKEILVNIFCLIIGVGIVMGLIILIAYPSIQAEDEIDSFCEDMGVVKPEYGVNQLTTDRSVKCAYLDEDEYVRYKEFTPKQFRLWRESQ